MPVAAAKPTTPAHKLGKATDAATTPTHAGASSSSSTHNPLPALGRVNASHLLVGAKVWVADPKVLWRIGDVQRIDHDQQTAVVYVASAPADDDKLQTLSIAKLYTFDASHIIDHDDVAAMNNMHEAPLLNVLRQRFEADRIYTFTADILLSINPYKSIPLLYDVMGFMEQAAQAATSESGAAAARPPHLFTIAEKAYAGMKGELPGTGTSQSIIISGESGAGKTEASKYIMKYLATASKHVIAGLPTGSIGPLCAPNVHERIEECVVLSNLILESFGNAKTSRNDNSSRFGKYIQILYNADGRMVGVSIRHFLLEKTRLVLPQANERNYHIFYQLLAGLPQVESDGHFHLHPNVWNYTYLTHGDCVDVDGVDDAVEFTQLRTCLRQLGMDNDTFQLPMFAILAAILQLGNVQFEAIASSSREDETAVAIFPESTDGVDLEHISKLLGVEPQAFAKKMVTQTTVTGRGSILELQLTPAQAKNAMDALCKHLYGELFHHLIQRINASAKTHTDAALDASGSSGSSGPRAKHLNARATAAPVFIGILDIFGFEVMQLNSLEQLCINFTNETLQQQFNRHVFVLEQERYAAEGIAFGSVEFQDNQPTLDLIQKPPTGLLPLLEEQMLLKRKTTDKQLLTIYHGQHLDKHASYSKPRFECDEFVIRHYAGEVVYGIHGFIGKNTDNLHDDLLDLLRNSTQPLVRAIFTAPLSTTNPASVAALQKRGGSAAAAALPHTPTNKGKASGGASLTGTSTVTSRFRLQLAELMDVLWQTTPNYIKCIKPNNLKFPGGFSCELVRDQLIYSGVLEVVRIRQEGFPIRKRFDVFYELFWPLGRGAHEGGVTTGGGATPPTRDLVQLRQACERIATTWLLESVSTEETTAKRTKQVFAMGRQEVFLRYGQIEKLEAFVAALRAAKAMRIQTVLARGRVARRRFERLQRGMRQLQARWRMVAARKRYNAFRTAAVVVQSLVRRWRCRRAFQAKRQAANVLYHNVLRFLTHRRVVLWQQQTCAAVAVQRHVRGFLLRTAAERKRKLQSRSILVIQTWQRMATHRRAFLHQRQAAITIQSRFKSRKQRQAFVQLQIASIVVASFARQVLARRRFTLLKRRVVKFQALVRQSLQRKRFRRVQLLVRWLQSKRRQLHAKQQALQRRLAISTLQHAMRGWSCRCLYLRQTAGVYRLQYWASSWLMRRTFKRQQRAVRRIQRAYRHHRRLREWKLQVDSLFRSSFASPSTVVASGSGTPFSKMADSARRLEHLRQHPALWTHVRPRAFGFNSLFHHAAACGDMDVVQFMLTQMGIEPRELLFLLNGKHNTALHEASRSGQYAMVKFLLVAMANHEQQHDDAAAVDCKAPTDTTSDPLMPPAAAAPLVMKERDETTSPSSSGLSMTPGIIFSGYLRKRRETSRWMTRFVVLRVLIDDDAHMDDMRIPQLEYYDTQQAAQAPRAIASQTLDLRVAVVKKSVDTAFAFELHSPQLLTGRNKEGRLYFAASSEVESQQWLAHLRDAVPSTLANRLFAMHRSAASGALEYVDFAARARMSNLRNNAARSETPLHLAARVALGAMIGTCTSETLDGIAAAAAAASTLSPLTPVGDSSRTMALSPKAAAIEPATLMPLTTASTPSSSSISLSVSDTDERSNHHNSSSLHSLHSLQISSSSDIPFGGNLSSASDVSSSNLFAHTSRLELEADVVRTVLWLIESGAAINARTARNESALQLAIRANNLLVAKHLLDRGALATGLLPAEVAIAQQLKAALAKTAISSVGGSNNTYSASRTSSIRGSITGSISGTALIASTTAAASALATRLGSFRTSALRSSGSPRPSSLSIAQLPPSPSASSSSQSNAIDPEHAPPLFLLKQPGRVRNSLYVSVFLEHIGISNPHFLTRPRVLISVLDATRHVVERKQLVAVQPVVLATGLLWAITWHMQTPLENLPHGACIVLELTITPTVATTTTTTTQTHQRAASMSSMAQSPAARGMRPLPTPSSIATTAADAVPVCWTFVQIDPRTANSMPLNAEMYKYPLDLTLTKLQRVDAFVSGDVLVSQGPLS